MATSVHAPTMDHRELNHDLRTNEAAFCLALLVAAVASFAVGVVEPRFTVLSMALLACLAVTWPFALVGMPRLTSWTLIAATSYVGFGLRTIYIAFRHPDSLTIDAQFLLGHTADEFVPAAAWIVVFFLVLSVAFVVSFRLSSRRKRSDTAGLLSLPTDATALRITIVVFALVAIIAAALFLQTQGGLELVSAKRGRLGDSLRKLGHGASFQSYGHLRILHQTSIVALILYLIARGRRRMAWHHWATAGCLFLLAISLPFYANSRSTVLSVALMTYAYFYITQGRVSRRALLSGAVVVLVVVQMLTSFRTDRDATFQDAVEEGVSAVPASIDTFALARNLADIPKTGHVWVGLSDDTLESQRGRTLAATAIAVVPRALWPEKPVVTPGPLLAQRVYNIERAGVPPGLPAEALWNFGPFGGLLLAAFAAVALGALDARLRRGIRTSDGQLLLYVIVVIPLGGVLLSSSVSQAFIDTATNSLLCVAAAMLANLLTRRDGRASSGSLVDP